MFSHSLLALAVYLLLGFLTSSLLRKGRPEDWTESLLASIIALPMVILITTAVLARRAKHRMTPPNPPSFSL